MDLEMQGKSEIVKENREYSLQKFLGISNLIDRSAGYLSQIVTHPVDKNSSHNSVQLLLRVIILSRTITTTESESGPCCPGNEHSTEDMLAEQYGDQWCIICFKHINKHDKTKKNIPSSPS